MEKHVKEHLSPWLKYPTDHSTTPLKENMTTEICIIGAGISGLTAAYLLLNAGFKVIVIDKDKLYEGDTYKTSAHLTNALDGRFYNIIKAHGKKHAALAAESHATAINMIEEIIQQEKIDCDFRRVKGYLFSNKESDKELQNEYEATQNINLETSLGTLPVGILCESKEALIFPHQAQFHPVKYLSHLVKLIKEKGGFIYDCTLAKDVDVTKNIVYLENNKEIKANYIIQTSYMPVQCSVFINTKIEPTRTYVMGFAIPKNTLAMNLYWDTENPYHYIRIQPNDGSFEHLSSEDDLLIVGGEDHRVGYQPSKDPYAALEKWIRKRVPQVKEILFEWSGQILEPLDELAYIGVTLGGGKNNYMLTGHSGNGLTHGTLGAMLIADLIIKNANKWQDAYQPDRKNLYSISKFLTNVSKSTIGYLRYVTGGGVQDIKSIPRGEGDVIRKGVHKIAIYKDEHGKVHEFSAVCPHLKAIISWNPIEKSWDCPAHGSRFSATGKLMNGPASCDLHCSHLIKE